MRLLLCQFLSVCLYILYTNNFISFLLFTSVYVCCGLYGVGVHQEWPEKLQVQNQQRTGDGKGRIIRVFIKQEPSEHLEVRFLLFPFYKIKKEKVQQARMTCPQVSRRSALCRKQAAFPKKAPHEGVRLREQSLALYHIHCRHKTESKRERERD